MKLANSKSLSCHKKNVFADENCHRRKEVTGQVMASVSNSAAKYLHTPPAGSTFDLNLRTPVISNFQHAFA